MAVYDILFHTGVGHPHFLDGGIIILKPHNSEWTAEELALGTKASMNISDNNIATIQRDISQYTVNNKSNPSDYVRN